ncbi:hypothetical protein AB0I60_29835 [Actinosynnema sp. NPDC050436]|uniref:hypothetical protein n=1 Tax=Actinosynnema sp. NPDC050436 TaxID=3155659 RepID=UPI0033DF66FD
MKRNDSRYLLAPALGLVLGMGWLFVLAVLAWGLDDRPVFPAVAVGFTALWVAGSGVLSWWVLRRYGARRPALAAGAAIGVTLLVSLSGYVWLPTFFAPLVFALCFLVAAFAVDLLPAHANGPLRGRRPQGPVQ